MVVGCVSLVHHQDKMVGIRCSRDRGIILPGGKPEKGEDFKQAAARELLEETGLQAKTQLFLFGGLADDGAYVYTFLTTINEFAPRNSSEGDVVLATWSDLFSSRYRGYYRILSDVLAYRRERP